MKNELCVLITAAGSINTTSKIDCLKNNYEKRKVRVVCTDKIDVPIMHYKADSFHLLPHGRDKNYIKNLLNICKKERVDVILPCSLSEVMTIANHQHLLISKKIIPAVSSYNSIKKMNSKYATNCLLEKEKIPIPRYFLTHNKKEFLKAIRQLGYPKKPICFKPSNSFSSGGARGFRILRSKNSIGKIIFDQKPESKEIDLETSLRSVQDKNNFELLVMEYLTGEHFTVHILSQKGKMEYCVPLQVERPELGYAHFGIIKKNPKIEKICEQIVKTMNFDFIINIQFRLSKNGTPNVLEINPRIAGTIGLPMAIGINLPYFAVKQALGEKIPKIKQRYGAKMIKHWEEFYVNHGKGFEF